MRLFDTVVFNVLIGNGDAHGKNFSLLREQGSVRLAPLYDLISTQAYPGLAREMAMRIGGERDPQRLNAKNWSAFFDRTGMSRASAQRRLLATANRVLASAHQLTHEKHLGSDVILPIVQENFARLTFPKG